MAVNGQYKWTEERKSEYLDFVRSGMRRTKAAKAIDMCYQHITKIRKADPVFAREEHEAELEACEPIEDALYQKCLAGDFKSMVFWLLNRSSERWQDKRTPSFIQQVEKQPTESMEELKNKLIEKLNLRNIEDNNG